MLIEPQTIRDYKMKYAQMLTHGLMTGNLIDACGDRSVVLLDGRLTLDNQIAAAVRHAKKYRYPVIEIRKAERLNTNHFTTLTRLEVSTR